MKLNLVSVLFLAGIAAVTKAQSSCPTNKKVIKCYWTNWSIYRPGDGQHQIEYIIPEYCTHLVYAFTGMNLDDQMDSLDFASDITAGNYNKFIALKETYPCVKFLIAIGGWNEGSEKYSVVFEDPESRAKFVRGVLRFLVFYGFDGIDIDWEYPATRGGLSSDRENLVNLTSELKDSLTPRNRIVTIAIPAVLSIVKNGYDVEQICENVELVSVMGYDLNYPDKASVHSPLKRESSDPAARDTIDNVVQHLIKNNCPRSKIVVGVPTYGRSFTLKLIANNALNAQVVGPGNGGKYSRTKGFLGYNEICDFLGYGNWTVKHLQQNAVKYAYSGTQWVSYDDRDTVKQKAEYVLSEKLGGIMFWSLDTDDFHGGCHSESYPLLVAANKAFGNKLPTKSAL